MRKHQRREQLLATALTMIREEGAHELTLATLAAKAGVTKPITYEHFQTREGLLISLYQALDSRHTAAATRALAQCTGSLQDAAEVIAAAYIDCALEAGPEGAAIETALAASGVNEGVRRAQEVKYVELYTQSLGPFVRASASETRSLMIALVGASDALARDAASGRTARADVVATLSSLILHAVRASSA
jgi:AcrR family transcriptional regulator